MSSEEQKKLVEAWIELQKAEFETPRYEDLFWSFEAMYNLIHRDPDTAVEMILKILQADDSPKTLENLSAGPLEDLLAIHGAAYIARVEAEAARNPRFRHLLGGVWQNSMPRAIWHRVERCRDRRGWDGIPAAREQQAED